MFLVKNTGFYRFLLTATAFVLFTISVPFPANAQIFPNTNQNQEDQEPEFEEDELGRRTPRGTVSGFIDAVSDEDYSTARRYLNLSTAQQENREGERLAQVLQQLLDRSGRMLPLSWLSDENEGRTDDDLPDGVDRVGTVNADDETVELFVEQTTGPEGGPIWLFSSETVETIAVVSVEEPSIVEEFMPSVLKNNRWSGIPVGQWLAAVLLAALAFLLAWMVITFLHFIITRLWARARTEPTSGILNALTLPFILYLSVWFYVMLSREVGISIVVRQWFSGIIVVILLIAFLILLWRLTEFIGNFSKRKLTERHNVSGLSVILFVRRAAKIAIIIFGIIALLGTAGVDVTAGIAALGIGGIALALGAQKSMENFVGSVTLIADQPVRIGDFCKVGDTVGTVESIGMRSTRIRTNNRTVVTIPNGQFSSEKIENYTHRDRFFFGPVLDLRYETSPDQIRFLLVELRTILYSHPMVNPEPARVRFIELGQDSIKLEFFSYIDAPSFDIFLEVREDLLLRIMDTVATSGTDFAFPSQTIYFGKDKGLSEDKIKETEAHVKDWKENRKMQIPSFDQEKIDELKDTIKYPPEGSSKSKGQEEKLF